MLLLRIVGVFEKSVAATTIDVLLCAATVAVFVTALMLANEDRMTAMRAELLDLNEEPVDPTLEDSDDETAEKEPEEVEAGPSLGRESPASKETIGASDEPPSSASPWSSILSIGTLCGAETLNAETLNEEPRPETTVQARFDELSNLAIRAGVDRSEVSRLRGW